MKKIYIIFSIVWLLIAIFFFPKNTNLESNIEEIKVFNFIESDISIEVGNNFLKKKYIGKLRYLEPKNIEIVLKHKKEIIELGSNKDYFWYYSSYEGILNYGSLKNVNYIIKEVFNPDLMIKTFFTKIKKNGLQKDFITGDYGVTLERFLVVKDGKIISQKVVSTNGELIYTVDSISFHHNIPTKLVINYIKEGYFVGIELQGIKLKISNQKLIDVPFSKYEKSQLLTP